MNLRKITSITAGLLLILGLSGKAVEAQTIKTVNSGDGMAEAPMATSTPMTPTWNALFQTQANLKDDGNTFGLALTHVRLKGTFVIDAEDKLVIMPDFAPTGFTLLDAYAAHQFKDIKGFSVMAGQFKFAFGDNRYLLPNQLKRTSYNAIDALAPGGATAKGWDVGLEVKEQMDSFTAQGDVIQGAGPDVSADNNNTFDYVGRVEWKTSDFVLGLSDYYGEGGEGASYTYSTFQNWFGAHGRLMIESLDLRAEAIFAPGDASGFDLQASVKPTTWFEPVVWYETSTTKSVTTANNLGAGVNLWAGAKTRVSFDVAFIGLKDPLSANTETFQIEESF